MPKRARLQTGYTLIEILIVLFIISIVTSVAMLSIGRNEDKQMQTFANELAQVMSLAEEQAMLQPVVLGLTLSKHALQFTSYQSEKNAWIPFQDSVLGKQSIPHAMQVAIEIGGGRTSSLDMAYKKNPQVIVSTNGDVTPFTIYIGKKGERARYAVIGDADGNITQQTLS
jgi:general secretion pathway protein H